MTNHDPLDPRLIVLGLDPRLTKEEAIEELTDRVTAQIEAEFGIVLTDDPGHDWSEHGGVETAG